MLRILDGIERSHPQLAGDVKTRREEIGAAISRAREKFAPSAPLPRIDDAVFEVAFEMVQGVSFVVPPEGALDPDEWSGFHDIFPVQLAKEPLFHVKLWRSHGPKARAFLQLYSLDRGTAFVEVDGPEVAIPFESGPNVLWFTLPPAAQDGSVRITVRVEGAAPGRFGLRELIVCPD